MIDKGRMGPASYDADGAEQESFTFTDLPAERPLGVTIVALLNFLALAIVAVVLVTLWVSIPRASWLYEGQETLTQVFVGTCFSLFLGGLYLAIGIGLLRLRPWARTLALIVYGLGILLTLLGTFSTPITGATALRLIVSIAVVVYLLTPNARKALEEKRFSEMDAG